MNAKPMNVITDTRPEGLLRRIYGRFKGPVEENLFGESLKAKVFRGGAWLGTGSFSEQVVRFGRNMILTRLLAPEAFGTMAIVLSASSVVQTIMDVGVKEALIQNPRGNEEEYVGAAWWMAFGRAAMFWAVLSVVAPWIARFYGNHLLSPLLRVCAIGVLLDGAISSRAYVAIKNMKFRKWAIINHGGAIAGVFVTLALSFLLRNVWALVIGYCAESVGRFTLSYVVCPYLPPRRLPLVAIRDLLKFSKRAFGLSLLNLIFARTDIFVLAKMFSPAALGLYTMAIFLVQTPASFAMNLLGQTLLPTFSRIQEDKARTNRVLIQVTSALAIVGMPALVFVAFCGRSLLGLLYGPRYTAAVGPLIAASFVALLNAMNGQVTIVYYAKGMPQLHRRCVLITAATMIVLTYPFVLKFGLVGGQLAALVAISAGFLFQVVRLRDLTTLDPMRYVKVFAVFGAISAVIAGVCLSVRTVAAVSQPVPNILVGAGACTIAGGLGLFAFFRNVAGEIW
jgi:O-antigen/teichoic acid export membrane protein